MVSGISSRFMSQRYRDQFTKRFTDEMDKYRRQKKKSQPDEFVKSYKHRVSTAVDYAWTNPIFNDDQRTLTKMDF